MFNKLFGLFGLQKKQKPEQVKHTIVENMCIGYIVGEIVKFFPFDKQDEQRQSLTNKLSFLTCIELEVFVKIISKHYRNNAIYDYFFQKGYNWTEKIVPINEIYLTKINEKTNIYLEQLARPFNLTDLLSIYRKKKLPKEFELFQFDDRKTDGFKPICVQREDGRIDVLDGNHRICVTVLRNKLKQIPLYIGIK